MRHGLTKFRGSDQFDFPLIESVPSVAVFCEPLV